MKTPRVSIDPPSYRPGLLARLGNRFRPGRPMTYGLPNPDIYLTVWDLWMHHNALRRAGRLPELKISPALYHVADRFCKELAARDTLTHTRQSGTPFYAEIDAALGRAVGCCENAAMGQRTVEEAMESWKSSPGHYKNIMDGSMRLFGGTAVDAADGTTLWVVDMSE